MLRRDFLYFSSLFIAGCSTFTPLNLTQKTKNKLIQPYDDLATGKFGILCFDFENATLSHVETRFSVHSVFYDELLHEYIGVNKYGPEYLKFKNFSQSDLKYFILSKNTFLLSGHASSLPSDENYYLTGIHPLTQKSGILALNKKTDDLRVVAEIDACEPPAHDCKFSTTSDDLYFTGSNRIHIWNRKSTQLKSKEIALSTSKSSLRHFEINSNNELCLQSNVIHTKNNYKYENAEVVFQADGNTETFLVKNLNPKLTNNELLDFSFDRK